MATGIMLYLVTNDKYTTYIAILYQFAGLECYSYFCKVRHKIMEFSVRRTQYSDIETVMAIYDFARQKMRASGNYSQWVNGYPTEEIIKNDIDRENSYVIEISGGIVGIFTFIIGEEPTYKHIEGTWPDDLPYGTIHRIAAGADSRGIADIALDFCRKFNVNIRIDTHKDNTPMLGWINSRGFEYCGIIYVNDGTPREAFSYNYNGG